MPIRDLMPWREKGSFPSTLGDGSFAALRRDMDSLLHDFVTGGGVRNPETADRMVPAVNVSENSESWRVTAELPGVEEKEIQVSCENNLLVLSGKKSDEREEKGRSWYRRERRHGEFERAIELPPAVDADRAAATFAKGVLTIEIPKRSDAKLSRRVVPVKAV